MKIIKRSGQEVKFDINKIVEAIKKANLDANEKNQLSNEVIFECAKRVEKECKNKGRILTVEEVQD